MPTMRKLAVLAGAADAARRYARNNPEKVDRMMQKAARFVDRRTKGKYHDKIDDTVRKINSATRRQGS